MSGSKDVVVECSDFFQSCPHTVISTEWLPCYLKFFTFFYVHTYVCFSDFND